MTFTPGQLSFDSPAPVPVPTEPTADPLVLAIALHEDAKGKVQELSEPYKQADNELAEAKRKRDELKAELAKAQAVMDDAMRTRHDLHKRWSEACELSRQIGYQVREMGGIPAGNNSFWTPAKAAKFQSGEYRNMSDDEWQAMA